jgi:coenzyme F420-dependent glucose-6-phosphate dehydrogenase
VTSFSYHASHEQFAPSELIQLACLAEGVGFDAVFCSDHLQPWARIQGHSGHTWTWLGAALQATRHASFGTITVPGGWRYHPAVLAQMIATLGELFPGRLPWLAFGSGEALNEAALGMGWPAKDERHRRLEEGVRIVRDLLAGKTVTHQGQVAAQKARVWEQPATPPLLFGAAMSEQTAHWLGGWADGLLTLGRDLEGLERTIRAFRSGGGDGKPVHVKVDVAWGASTAIAEEEAHHHWRFTCLSGDIHHDLCTPEAFESASASVSRDDMHRHVLISSDPSAFTDHLTACQTLGASAIDIHHVGQDQRAFIRMFGSHVLLALRSQKEEKS